MLFWKEHTYHDDSTASRMLSEVKHHQAHLVLHWGTDLGYRVLLFLPAYHLLVRNHHMTYTNFACSVQRVILGNLGPNFDGRVECSFLSVMNILCKKSWSIDGYEHLTSETLIQQISLLFWNPSLPIIFPSWVLT